jgi:hypothetical protein
MRPADDLAPAGTGGLHIARQTNKKWNEFRV